MLSFVLPREAAQSMLWMVSVDLCGTSEMTVCQCVHSCAWLFIRMSDGQITKHGGAWESMGEGQSAQSQREFPALVSH